MEQVHQAKHEKIVNDILDNIETYLEENKNNVTSSNVSRLIASLKKEQKELTRAEIKLFGTTI